MKDKVLSRGLRCDLLVLQSLNPALKLEAVLVFADGRRVATHACTRHRSWRWQEWHHWELAFLQMDHSTGELLFFWVELERVWASKAKCRSLRCLPVLRFWTWNQQSILYWWGLSTWYCDRRRCLLGAFRHFLWVAWNLIHSRDEIISKCRHTFSILRVIDFYSLSSCFKVFKSVICPWTSWMQGLRLLVITLGAGLFLKHVWSPTSGAERLCSTLTTLVWSASFEFEVDLCVVLTWSEDGSEEHLVSHLIPKLCVLVFVYPLYLNDFLSLFLVLLFNAQRLLSISLAIVGSLAVGGEWVSVAQAKAIVRDVSGFLSFGARVIDRNGLSLATLLAPRLTCMFTRVQGDLLLGEYLNFIMFAWSLRSIGSFLGHNL